MDIKDIIQQMQERFPGAVEQTPGWLTVRKEAVRDVFQFLKTGPALFINLHCLTAVDRKETVEVVYHLYSFEHHVMLTVKVFLPNADLVVDSVTSLWQSADWMEREVFDLYGVRFQGHPDLRRILNPDTWTDHPLRKDFKREGVIPLPVK